MPVSNYPFGFAQGINIRGMQVLNTYAGNVFWVSSTAGNNGNPGTWQRPKATIAGALLECAADKGDVVICAPEHTEAITAAGGITLNVAGVTIIGLGNGRTRPTITFSSSTAATLLVNAARVTLANFVINLTGIDALAGPIAVQAADFSFLGNEVITGSASAQATLGILTTAAADRMLVQDCTFSGTTDAGTTAAIRLVGGDSIVLKDNVIIGAYSAGVGAIENLTTACTRLLIQGNVLNNQTASSTKVIALQAGTTGQISNNRMQILSGTAPITGAGISWVGANYYAAAVATAGTLI